MTLGVIYPWVVALHVAAAMAFVSGVIAVSVLLAAWPETVSGLTPAVGAVRRWDHTVTSPAMLVVWALGIALAITGHWFADAWLLLKLVFVLALSGLHGFQSGRLRRLARGEAVRPVRLAPVVLGCAVVIALLAVAKPF